MLTAMLLKSQVERGEGGGGGLAGKLCPRDQINIALLTTKFRFSSGKSVWTGQRGKMARLVLLLF